VARTYKLLLLLTVLDVTLALGVIQAQRKRVYEPVECTDDAWGRLVLHELEKFDAAAPITSQH
jgi:hypothetical protein